MGTAGAGREKFRPMRACLIKAALPFPFTCPWGSTVSIHSIYLIGYPITFMSTWVFFSASSGIAHAPACFADWTSIAPSFNRLLNHKQPPKDSPRRRIHHKHPPEIVTSFSYSNTTDISQCPTLEWLFLASCGKLHHTVFSPDQRCRHLSSPKREAASQTRHAPGKKSRASHLQ